MRATVYYDERKRVRALQITAQDGQDSLVLEKIANLIKDNSDSDIKVQAIGDINE